MDLHELIARRIEKKHAKDLRGVARPVVSALAQLFVEEARGLLEDAGCGSFDYMADQDWSICEACEKPVESERAVSGEDCDLCPTCADGYRKEAAAD